MRYLFGEFDLDADKHELTQNGAPVSIEPQVFSLLVYLIENREKVVSKDDIIEAVWDGRFVSDSAVSSRIKSARQAIGDDGQTQKYIKTIHGRGFRFVGEAREASGDTPPASYAPAPASPLESAAAARMKSPATRWIAGLLAAVVATGLVLFGLNQASGASAAQNRIAVLPVSNVTGDASLDWTEFGLMSLAAHDLADRSGENVVPARAIISAWEEGEWLEGGAIAFDEQAVARLQKAYGASHIIASRLSRSEGEAGLQLEYRMLNPRGLSPMRVLRGSEPTDLARQMSRDVLATLPRSGERNFSADTMSEDPFVAEAYARGRALQLEGQAEESRNLFQVAAEQDPGNIWLRYEYALSTRMMGELDEAESLLRTLEGEARGGEDEAVLGAILNGLGHIYSRRRETEEAVAVYEEALGIFEALGDPLRTATVLINLGIEERRLKNFDKAEAYLGRSLTEFEKAGYERPPGQLFNSLALLKVETGDDAAGEMYMERALDSFQLTGERRAEAIVLRNLADMSVRAGRWEEAGDRLLASLEIRRALDDRYGLASSYDGLAELRLKQGRVEEAREFGEEMLAVAEGLGDERQRLAAQRHLAEVVLLEGDWEQARAAFTALMQAHRASGSAADAMGARIGIARAQLGAGDHAAARSEAETVHDWAAGEDHDALALEASETLSDIAMGEEDAAQAAAHMQAALDRARTRGRPAEIARLAARLGHLKLDLGDETAAAGLLGIAREGHGGHYQTLSLAARYEARTGDSDAAKRSLMAAQQAAGAHWTEAFEVYVNEDGL